MEPAMSDAVLTRDLTLSKPRTRLSRKRALLAAAGLMVLLGAGYYAREWWTTGRFIETTDDAYVAGDVTAIAPHVAGFVADMLVTDNQHVSAGQVLLHLDARDFQTALDRAQATLQEREAALASLHAQLALQQDVIRQAGADLRARISRAAFADVDATRYANLADSPAGSRQQIQRTASARDEAQATVAAGQATLAAAQHQLAVLQANESAAQATVAQAQADVRTAELNRGYTEIRSPVDGYVGNRAARVGAYVATGAYLMSVIPAQGLWVDANFKEDQLAHMHPGQNADVRADAVPGRIVHGHLLSLSPGTGAVFSVIPPENATGNFTKIVQRVPVRIALDDDAAQLGALRPGLSTTVSVDTRGSAAP
jgi:membrane fusion protein (multidrug efflux system)